MMAGYNLLSLKFPSHPASVLACLARLPASLCDARLVGGDSEGEGVACHGLLLGQLVPSLGAGPDSTILLPGAKHCQIEEARVSLYRYLLKLRIALYFFCRGEPGPLLNLLSYPASRPDTTAAVKAEPDVGVVEGGVVRRARGRPRGSLNKKRPTAGVGGEEEEEEMKPEGAAVIITIHYSLMLRYSGLLRGGIYNNHNTGAILRDREANFC